MTVAILVSGRGSNLKAILEAGIPVRVVVSNVSEAPALSIATAHGVETLVLAERSRTERDQHLLRELAQRQVDLIALAGYNRVFTDAVPEAFPNRILNIHPSLLPAFPGLNPGPQRDALEAGVKLAGCTVHIVTAALDAGPIVAQSAVSVLPDDSVESLSARILEQEHILFPRTIRAVMQGKLRVEGNRAWLLD
ncbi:MAG TPA: phosphoribosylglycinamide formyltransferase [Chloroflexota bacterium]|nr:phosphoribosylglycinamide formyltransferase [Chloroflexota bacterium]